MGCCLSKDATGDRPEPASADRESATDLFGFNEKANPLRGEQFCLEDITPTDDGGSSSHHSAIETQKKKKKSSTKSSTKSSRSSDSKLLPKDQQRSDGVASERQKACDRKRGNKG
jgi:hypothetical protein